MNDEFNKKLWELGLDNPDLQEAIANCIVTPEAKPDGYTMPLGNIRESIFMKSDKITDEKRERIADQISALDGLTLEILTKCFAQLKVALTLKEAKGEPLTPLDKTYKDIDLTAFILFGMRRWLELFKPTEGDNKE